MSFVVAVKPSARKRNAKVGQLVFSDGTRHTFTDRADAERWAANLSFGDGHVWIAAAHPDDESDVDGYLLSRATNTKLEAAYDKRRQRLRGGASTEQRSLENGRTDGSAGSEDVAKSSGGTSGDDTGDETGDSTGGDTRDGTDDDSSIDGIHPWTADHPDGTIE